LKQGVEKVSNRHANRGADFEQTQEQRDEEQDEDSKLWMVTFRNIKNVILDGELEVRSKALTDLFELLTNNGYQFSKSFWGTILDEIVYPLFEELKKDPQDSEKETSAVWLSTTLVSALKLLVDLYTSFPLLIQMALDRLLDLIMLCIVQENDTLSRLGSKCIQDFVEKNVECFSFQVWDKVCSRIVDLFEVTMPKELWFDVEDSTSVRQTPFDIPFAPKPVRKEFPKIIVKCVLHLNAIQTLYKILSSNKQDVLLSSLDRRHIFTLGDLLYKSFMFAKMFNEDLELRTALMKMGFMKTLPNLIKQETTAATAYLYLMSKVFQTASPHATLLIAEVEKRLVPYDSIN
jgi:brefeldin A-inhibited guanine nucleotide-exchange protein